MSHQNLLPPLTTNSYTRDLVYSNEPGTAKAKLVYFDFSIKLEMQWDQEANRIIILPSTKKCPIFSGHWPKLSTHTESKIHRYLKSINLNKKIFLHLSLSSLQPAAGGPSTMLRSMSPSSTLSHKAFSDSDTWQYCGWLTFRMICQICQTMMTTHSLWTRTCV